MVLARKCQARHQHQRFWNDCQRRHICTQSEVKWCESNDMEKKAQTTNDEWTFVFKRKEREREQERKKENRKKTKTII